MKKIFIFRNWLVNLGVQKNFSSSINRRVELSNIYAMIFGLLTFFYGIIFIGLHNVSLGLSAMAFAFIFTLVLVFNGKGHYQWARYHLILNSILIVYIYAASFGQTTGLFFWFFTLAQIPFLVFELKEKKSILVCVGCTLCLFLFLWVSEFHYSVLPLAILTKGERYWVSISMLFCSFSTTLSMNYFVHLDYQKVIDKNDDLIRLGEVHMNALNISSIVAITDPMGKITYINDNFCKISGYSREEILGNTHAFLNSGYHPKGFFREMWKSILQKKIWQGEICNKTKTGSFYWVDTTIVPIVDADNNIKQIMAIRYDVTHRKVSEKSLIYSARMVSLGEMAGGLAHEINNPLAIICGRSQQLLQSIEKNEFTMDYGRNQVNKIIAISERISKIIHGLRTFSGETDQEDCSHVLMKDLVEETLSFTFEKFHQEGIQLDVFVADEMYLECRRVQIIHVLHNILMNAHDAVIDLPDKWIKLEVESLEQKISISITDSGPGISPEIVDKVMEPFFTTKDVGKGVGLGLSIAKGIVENHGGIITFDTKNQNTRFVIIIPKKQSKLKKGEDRLRLKFSLRSFG